VVVHVAPMARNCLTDVEEAGTSAGDAGVHDMDEYLQFRLGQALRRI
jgi:hypothetical protein